MGPEDGQALPTVLTSTSFDEALCPRPEPAEMWIRPFVERGSPFLGWTPLEVRTFFVSNCNPYQDFDAWPVGTFGILDSLSVLDPGVPTHRTILVCSTLPDFGEKNEIWLKTCRVKFEDFAIETCRLETLITRPSELGKVTCLSFAIPLIFEGRDAARERVSYDLDNPHPYSDEHMAMQGSNKGCVRYLVRAANPDAEEEEIGS